MVTDLSYAGLCYTKNSARLSLGILIHSVGGRGKKSHIETAVPRERRTDTKTARDVALRLRIYR